MVERSHVLRYPRLWLSFGIALIAAVVVMSLWPSPPKTTLSFADKIVHLLAYFTLMTWFAQIYYTRRARLLWLVALCLLGGGLELVQGTMPTRSADPMDALANGIGALAGWVATHGGGKRVLAALERALLSRG